MTVDSDSVIGVLNGVVGDYLRRAGNALATPLGLVHGGCPLAPTRDVLRQTFPQATGRIVVLVHGLMATERCWQMEGGETYGSLLSRDFGYTPIFVRYNTGLRVSDNGEALDALLEKLIEAYPVAPMEVALIGHSMGGLVLRSATRAAGATKRSWLSLTKRAFYLGVPHLGAPLERFANILCWTLKGVGSPQTKLIADILNLRSGGVKDLGYGNLRREDWHDEADALLQSRRHPVPLVPSIRHHLIAGTVTKDPTIALLFGDAIVPVRSATGRARPKDRCVPFPQQHVRVMPAISHPKLAHDPCVYAQIRAWFQQDIQCR